MGLKAKEASAMSEGQISASICSSSAVKVISVVPRSAQSFNPTVISRLEGRPVVRSPKQLQLHPALQEIGWTGVIDEFNDAARNKDQSVPVPILITTNGTILGGIGRWQSALFDDRREINCFEYSLTEEEADVLLRHGTEAPFCGGLLNNKTDGVYLCRLCGLPLFRARTKFDSGTGWPSLLRTDQ